MSPAWNSCHRSLTTCTGTRLSSSPSWDEVPVSRSYPGPYPPFRRSLPVNNPVSLAANSLHLRRLDPAARRCSALSRWLDHRLHRSWIHRPRVHSLDRATLEHAQGRERLGSGAGLNLKVTSGIPRMLRHDSTGRTSWSLDRSLSLF